MVSNSAVFPGHEEVCDEQDNDCNGAVDDGALDALTWYEDADGDTYGNELLSVESCTQPEGFEDNNDDCDDPVPYPAHYPVPQPVAFPFTLYFDKVKVHDHEKYWGM